MIVEIAFREGDRIRIGPLIDDVHGGDDDLTDDPPTGPGRDELANIVTGVTRFELLLGNHKHAPHIEHVIVVIERPVTIQIGHTRRECRQPRPLHRDMLATNLLARDPGVSRDHGVSRRVNNRISQYDAPTVRRGNHHTDETIVF